MTYSLKKALCALAIATPLSLTALAAAAEEGPITVHDPYARIGDDSGAIFLVLENNGPADDRLTGATAYIADKVELHSHRDAGNGVMQMVPVPEGFVIPAGGSHALARGGDHIMLMGLRQDLPEGEHFIVTLHFEKAGDVLVDTYVNNQEDAMGGMGGQGQGGHDHSAHGHGAPASTSP